MIIFFLLLFKYLEEEYRKGAREDDPMPPVQPYHYGSHYSNSGTVLHFLVRLPPFTKMFLAYQGKVTSACTCLSGQGLSDLGPSDPGMLYATLFSIVCKFQIAEFSTIKSSVLSQ